MWFKFSTISLYLTKIFFCHSSQRQQSNKAKSVKTFLIVIQPWGCITIRNPMAEPAWSRFPVLVSGGGGGGSEAGRRYETADQSKNARCSLATPQPTTTQGHTENKQVAVSYVIQKLNSVSLLQRAL